MTSIAKRQKLHKYIDIANNGDIDVLLTYIEKAMEPDVPYNKWDDAEFVAEMDRRVKAMEDGTDKGHTWEEVKRAGKKSCKIKNSKMSYTLIFNVEAENEYLAAYAWYEEQQQGLGERFEKETEKQLEKIRLNPLTYHFSKGNYRESLVDHFPFTIVYVLNKKKKTIYISAVFHTSRNPKGKYRD